MVEDCYVSDLPPGEAALPAQRVAPVGVGYDVARMGGDRNAVVALYRPTDYQPGTPYRLDVLDSWSNTDHNENERRLRTILDADGWNKPNHTTPLAVDATPEGSKMADDIANWYPPVYRFLNGKNALNEQAYKDHWAEGLALLGRELKNGVRVVDRQLREELFAAARVISYEERYYSSRDTEVYKATKKKEVKTALDNRSPDLLDAAIMACFAANADFSLTYGKRPRQKRPRMAQGRGSGGGRRTNPMAPQRRPGTESASRAAEDASADTDDTATNPRSNRQKRRERRRR